MLSDIDLGAGFVKKEITNIGFSLDLFQVNTSFGNAVALIANSLLID